MSGGWRSPTSGGQTPGTTCVRSTPTPCRASSPTSMSWVSIEIRQRGGHSTHLEPPSILPAGMGTSHDQTVGEGEDVMLACKPEGHPPPRVNWRREDGLKIRDSDSGEMIRDDKCSGH